MLVKSLPLILALLFAVLAIGIAADVEMEVKPMPADTDPLKDMGFAFTQKRLAAEMAKYLKYVKKHGKPPKLQKGNAAAKAVHEILKRLVKKKE